MSARPVSFATLKTYTTRRDTTQMVDDGLIELSWKGKNMPSRSGPYRIGRAHRED